MARKLHLSEASVKRMFSKRDFTLKRLDEICQLTNAEFSDLARILHEEETLISQLTWEQEKEIVSDRKLFLVAVCALNHVTFEQIVAAYDIEKTECIQLLVRLDRLGFIQLQPNNRIKLLVSPQFLMAAGWTDPAFLQPAGAWRVFPLALRPAARVHGRGERHAVTDFQRRDRVPAEARRARVLRAAQRRRQLPLTRRSAMSLLVAIRHWELQAFAELRRRKPPPTREHGGRRGS